MPYPSSDGTAEGEPTTSQANIVINHKPTTRSADSVTNDIAGSSQDNIVNHNKMDPIIWIQEDKSEATNDCQTNSSAALQPKFRNDLGNGTTENSSDDNDLSPVTDKNNLSAKCTI